MHLSSKYICLSLSIDIHKINDNDPAELVLRYHVYGYMSMYMFLYISMSQIYRQCQSFFVHYNF